MHGIFITGTDTEVGKTIVTAGLLRYLRSQGVDAVPMKPVQTGGIRVGDRLTAPDLEAHLAAGNLAPAATDIRLMAPYVYEPACSPHLAARMAGDYPDFHVIADAYATLARRHDLVLVEGAGGVYAPIDEERTMLDLMKRLDLPVLLVARRGLGTINHSLLSIEALRNAGLTLLGIVFNETEKVERDYIREDNPATVEQFSGVPVLGDLDYMEHLEDDPDAAWAHFELCTTKLLEELAPA